MSKSLVWLLSSVIGSASLVGAAGVAQAQVYVDAGADFYVGDTVQVYAADGAYDATVLQISGPSVLVRYLDSAWGATEWVDGSRLSYVPNRVQVVGYRPSIQVYWGNSWIDGTLLARRGNRYHVRYQGRSEWVTADRWHHRDGSHYRVPSYGRRVHAVNRGGWNNGHRDDGRHGQMRGDSQRGGRDHGRNDGGRKGGNGRNGGGRDGGRNGGHGGGRGH